MTFYWPLVTLHVILFAYWLGGDFGVFVCAKYISRADLPVAERQRFLQALLSIDILPRTAIVLLPVVGLQLATLRLSINPPRGFMVAVWIVGLCWLALVWTIFLRRGTPLADRLQTVDVGFRVVLVVALVIAGVASLLHGQPAHETWIACKFIVYAVLLCIGLYLRAAIRAWRIGFQRLAREGSTPEIEALFTRSHHKARYAAFLFWSLIATMAWLGIAKPA